MVLGRIGTAMQFGPVYSLHSLHVMAGQQCRAIEITRQGKQVGELDGLVAFDARHRRLAAGIAIGKGRHHCIAKACFHIDDIVRDA